MPYAGRPQLASLIRLSERLGKNLLITQGTAGNTSVKIGGALWIKASGTWLADAGREDLFLPLDLAEMREAVHQGRAPAEVFAHTQPTGLEPSVETAMHVVLPHPVVVHVHAVNTIAWAVRQDAPVRLAEKLAGLPWQWIPYVRSGLPLAASIAQALSAAPDSSIFIIGNHGLVIGGETCDSVREQLECVEQRLNITPRRPPEPQYGRLERLAGSNWNMPSNATLHGLATDPVSRDILERGLLYPSQAILPGAPGAFRCRPESELSDGHESLPFVLVKDWGLLVNKNIPEDQYATLTGLALVLERSNGGIRYLTPAELADLKHYDYKPQPRPGWYSGADSAGSRAPNA